MNAEQLIADVEQDVLTWRRHLHANPELSFQEHKRPTISWSSLHALAGLKSAVRQQRVWSRICKVLLQAHAMPYALISMPCLYRKKMTNHSARRILG